MATALDLHNAVRARLEQIGNTVTYDAGAVPDKPPADSIGRVYPYYLLAPTPGTEPGEDSLAADVPVTDLDWLVQVTCVGGTLSRCLQGAQLARAALGRAYLVAGATPLREIPMRVPAQVDPDVTPARLILPLQFECVAT